MTSGDEADDARFLQVSNHDTNQFIDEMKNYNTKKQNQKKTKSDLKILSEWLHGDNELRAYLQQDHRTMRNTSPTT